MLPATQLKMIDLHTHTLLTDGELLPSELVRHYHVAGYRAVALTDHVDGSNIDFVVPRIVKISQSLTELWDIEVIAGVELTHMPLEEFKPSIEYARAQGVRLILVHGETTVEPVIPGTNKKALENDINILAHPGLVTLDDAKFAHDAGIFLELTARRGHCLTNSHVVNIAREGKAGLILNSDAHSPEDILNMEQREEIGRSAGLREDELKSVFKNAEALLEKIKKNLDNQ